MALLCLCQSWGRVGITPGFVLFHMESWAVHLVKELLWNLGHSGGVWVLLVR